MPLVVGVDSLEGVRRAADCGVAVSVEIDSGLARSGVAAQDAAALAEEARALGVPVRGVFTFPGHGYGVGRARADAADDEARTLREAGQPACGRRASTTWC